MLVFWFWREIVFGVSIYRPTVTIVSQKYRELSLQVDLVNNHSIPSTHAERKITVRSYKHSFTPYSSLSP